jgi:hypothetical protein
MANVQFTNKDDVLQAYKRMKVAPWAIWCGKALNFSCSNRNHSECEAELTEYLEMLDRNPVPVYYTLCVYRDLDDDEINSKTPYSSSFNFRLSESGVTSRGYGSSDGSMNGMTVGSLRKQWEQEQQLLNEIKALRMEVQELKESESDDPGEDDDYGMGKIGRILQHPTVGPMAQQLVNAITGFLTKQQPGRVLAGVPGEPPGNGGVADDLQILGDAIPDFPDILHKLALMAQRNPGQLKLYCDALRSMQL